MTTFGKILLLVVAGLTIAFVSLVFGAGLATRHHAAPGAHRVVCLAPHSRNPMDVVVDASVYVTEAGWGVIERPGSKQYFWAGACTITREART